MTTMTDGSGVLLAVLLNPPEGASGVRTRSAIEAARHALGFQSVEIANLCCDPTLSVLELNALGHDRGWVGARADLLDALHRADGVLAGWGIAGLSGKARRARDSQVGWLLQEADRVGLTHFWTVGGVPRHPSRWHQYVADKHNRTSGGSFVERLRQVLVRQAVLL
jgi:hypothetical protein